MASPGFDPLHTCSWICLPHTHDFGVSVPQPIGTLTAAPMALVLSVMTTTWDANTHCWELEVGSGAIPEGLIPGDTEEFIHTGAKSGTQAGKSKGFG